MPHVHDATNTHTRSHAVSENTSSKGVSVPAAPPFQLKSEGDINSRINGRSGTGVDKNHVIQAAFQHLKDAGEQRFHLGLIKGTYRPQDNSADMHVAAAGEGQHLDPQDAVNILSALYDVMVQNHNLYQQVGTIDWRPTGAPIVKMVIELLGEALGGKYTVLWARINKTHRKHFGKTSERSPYIISKEFLPEYKTYLDAMHGENKVSIKPTIPGESTALSDKGMEADDIAKVMRQDMMEDSPEGKERLKAYKASLDAGLPSSLQINLPHTQLPSVISVLRSAGRR